MSDSYEYIREMASAFAEVHIIPHAARWDQMPEPRRFPFELYRALGDAGFLGFSGSPDHGGRGRPFSESVVLIEELAYYDVAVAVMTGIPRLVTHPILSFGTEVQKQQYVAPCLSGETVCAFALTEPAAGSDAAGLKTTAKPTPDGYVISGDKMFITHAEAADVALLFCKIEDQDKPSAFIVETGQPGWDARVLKQKLGIRATTTCAVKIRDLEVPASALLGEEGRGFRYAMETLDGARVSVAAQALGLSRRCLDESIEHAKGRVAFGKPIAKQQAIQWMIADVSTRLEAARLLTYMAAALIDEGDRCTLEAAQAKLFATEASNFCADRAMQIHGGYGYVGDCSVIEKLYRDQRFLEIGEGTSEIQRRVISGQLLGR